MMTPVPSDGRSDLSVDEARERMLAAVAAAAPLPVETVPLIQAAGRVLAQDVLAPRDVPPHDNSAMDGYALDGAALAAGQPLDLVVIGRALAGHPFPGRVGPGQCVRIMTGAAMPAGTDTVVPQELCVVGDGRVGVPANGVRRGEHRRRRGEDLPAGGVALAGGRRLGAADVGLAASLGLTRLPVRRRLRVALFSSGDELREPGAALSPAAQYDSNRYALQVVLQAWGFDVQDLGCVADTPQALTEALSFAERGEADVVVTSGGVSVGDADHTRAVLAGRGTMHFWSVAMRPGRPFAFGALRSDGDATALAPSRWMFALPGNPVAALISLAVLARPAMQALAGELPKPLPQLCARAAAPLRKRVGRTEFPRVHLRAGADGVWEAYPLSSQGSGMLSGLSQAQGVAVLGAAVEEVQPGQWIPVIALDALLV